MDAVVVWLPVAGMWLCVGPEGIQALGATSEQAVAEWRAALAAAALIQRARNGAAATLKLGGLKHG